MNYKFHIIDIIADDITYTKKITETVDTPNDLKKVIKMMGSDKLMNRYLFKN